MNVVTIAVAAKPPQGSDTKDEIHGNFRESDVCPYFCFLVEIQLPDYKA